VVLVIPKNSPSDPICRFIFCDVIDILQLQHQLHFTTVYYLLVDFFVLLSLRSAKLSNLCDDVQVEALLVQSGSRISILEQNHAGGLSVCIPLLCQF
jgi:hypothetical protein